MDVFAASVVWAGLIVFFASVLSVVKPIRFLGFRSRRHALKAAGLGFAALLAAMIMPAWDTRAAGPAMRLDEFVPVYQFHEAHRTTVHASPEECYAAIRATGPEEIWMFGFLTAIQRGGRNTHESITHAPEHQPLLDTAIRNGFLLLADEPGREFVVGMVMGAPRDFPAWMHNHRLTTAEFLALDAPRLAKVAMNFRIERVAERECVVTTETRIFAIGDFARRAFAAYWRVIYPGSSWIRRMWLRAIRKRAEAHLQSACGGRSLPNDRRVRCRSISNLSPGKPFPARWPRRSATACSTNRCRPRASAAISWRSNPIIPKPW